MSAYEIKNTADLRQALINQLQDLREKKITPREALEFTRMAREIVNLAKLDLEYMRMNREGKKPGEISEPKAVPALRLIG